MSYGGGIVDRRIRAPNSDSRGIDLCGDRDRSGRGRQSSMERGQDRPTGYRDPRRSHDRDVRGFDCDQRVPDRDQRSTNEAAASCRTLGPGIVSESPPLIQRRTLNKGNCECTPVDDECTHACELSNSVPGSVDSDRAAVVCYLHPCRTLIVTPRSQLTGGCSARHGSVVGRLC